MNQQDFTTAQYQVVGIEYLEQIKVKTVKLIKQFDNLSFFVEDTKPPTDNEIMLEFSHLDFGVT